VTGGAGFIGANFVLAWLAQCDEAMGVYREWGAKSYTARTV
jgi:dTDP-D-glucose 4,6-dehydratase